VREFLTEPSAAWQHISPKHVTWTPETRSEFDKAVSVGAVVVVDADDPSAPLLAAVCPVFVIEQHEGKLRLIFDLRVLNDRSIPSPPFDLDTIYDLPSYLAAHPDLTVTAKIDLTKAYWKVPVSLDSQPLFGCRGPDSLLYRWSCLPFGWTHAPHLFQSITACFRDAWRSVGIRCCVYLDDFIYFSSSVDTHLDAMDVVTSDLLEAGWQLTPEKCPIEPVHSITYLGIDVNVLDRSFTLPPSRIEQLIAGALALLAPSPQPLAELATFIGRANFARVVLPRCGFFLVHLYTLLPSDGRPDINPSSDPDPDHPLSSCPIHRRRDLFSGTVDVSPAARAELLWWSTTARERLQRHAPWDRIATARVWVKHGASVSGDPVATGRSDASDTGVGNSWQRGDTVHRCYDLLPQSLLGTSSTARELYGAARLVEAMPPLPPRSLVRIILDSQASVFTVNGGSACVGTVEAAVRLDAALDAKDVDAMFEWAPRALLDAEDADSRVAVDDASFATVPPASRAFLLRWCRFGQAADVECFASGAEHSWPIFGSRWPSAGSSGDGVALLRSSQTPDVAPPRVWAFPPFALARPAAIAALNAAVQCPSARILLLLPSDAHLTRCLRDAGWHSTTGPRQLLLPDGSFRAPSRPLIAFASPTCRPTPPQQETRSR
jgi:hypothetical protein